VADRCEDSLLNYMMAAANEAFPDLGSDADCECDELTAAQKKIAELEAQLQVAATVPERLRPLAVLARVKQTLETHTDNIRATDLRDMAQDIEDCLELAGVRG
jgi:hypothetical protein